MRKLKWNGRAGAASALMGMMAIALLAGCAPRRSTVFTSTWTSPDALPVAAVGQRVAVVFISDRDVIRRSAEDALARHIARRGGLAFPTYTVLLGRDVRNREIARTQLVRAGANYVVTMRVIGARRDLTYTPGYWVSSPYHRNLWGYWDYGWGAVYEPGYLTTDTKVQVETLVYDVNRNQLVWAGISETVDPDDLDDLVEDVAERAAEELARKGLIAS